MQIVHSAPAPGPAIDEASLAMARTLNAASNGSPIDAGLFTLACRSGGLDPEHTLAALVGARVLAVRGQQIYLGEVGLTLVVNWYLFA